MTLDNNNFDDDNLDDCHSETVNHAWIIESIAQSV